MPVTLPNPPRSFDPPDNNAALAQSGAVLNIETAAPLNLQA